MKALLEQRGMAATFVRFGERFARRVETGHFEINPTRPEDYRQLFEALNVGVAGLAEHRSSGSADERATRHGRQAPEPGLLVLQPAVHRQAIGDLNISIPVTIGAVTNRDS